jgi:MFS transporter, DHA2 family, multidrug resistance protein
MLARKLMGMSMEIAARTSAEARPETTVATWLGFATMCIGMFMAILDIQIVATSLPTIQDAIGIRRDQMSWIQTAYLTAEVIAIPLTGLLTRLLTMRWLFVIAISGFTIASIGCAMSDGFASLIVWRVMQGLSGGVLIPTVFSAVFLLFPYRRQGVATTIAGLLAVLAPTIGPVVGGWVTETYSWHWLFLINVAPGLAAAIGASFLLPRAAADLSAARKIDAIALCCLALALTSFEFALKEAPSLGWFSPIVAGLYAASFLLAWAFVRRTLGNQTQPLVDLRAFANRNFTVGCILSFVLGIGLFGSVYLMPVFLAFVRQHSALEIGAIMLVTGAAQLLTAPLAVWLERRVDSRLLAIFGFAVFGIGLCLSAFQTRETDFDAMLWPQIIRGVAIMFCILPPTRLALGCLEAARVPNASGLFNLMRNLGGAIGLALIDSIIYGRTPHHIGVIAKSLRAGDTTTAAAVGIPLSTFKEQLAEGPPTEATLMILRPLVKRLALVEASNEAWLLIALLTFAALLSLAFAKPSSLNGPA